MSADPWPQLLEALMLAHSQAQPLLTAKVAMKLLNRYDLPLRTIQYRMRAIRRKYSCLRSAQSTALLH